MTSHRSRAARPEITRGLIVAGVLLAATVVIRLLSPAHLDPGVARRLLGILLGAVVVGYANGVPKALSPLMRMRCDPAAEQALRRFTGWSLALGGTAYAAAWAIAPLTHANLIGASLLGTAVLLVLVRIALAGPGRSRD